jgi:hypothetical protein
MFGVMAWPRQHRPDIDRRSWLALWSTLWTGGAFLHLSLVYSGRQAFDAILSMTSDGSPRYLADTSHWFAGLTSHHTLAVVMGLVVLEFTIGLSWLFDPTHQRMWLGLGIGFSLFFWVVGSRWAASSLLTPPTPASDR